MPAITRKTDTGMPRYVDADESDVFVLSGSEDLVPVLVLDNGTWIRRHAERTIAGEDYVVYRYRPRVEGLFARIERWTRSATVTPTGARSPGTTSRRFYGRTPQSRIADPQDPRRVFSWLLCESDDDHGNAMVYDYVAEDGAGVDVAQAHERRRDAGPVGQPLPQANPLRQHAIRARRRPI